MRCGVRRASMANCSSLALRSLSPASPSSNHGADIAAMDLFVVPTVGFGLLYALVIIRLARRELVRINVTANPTAKWIARQIT
jgi:hypothetical protein